MKNLSLGILAVLILALLGADCYWAFHGLSQMDIEARLNHEFTVAAYTITWAIQLGYLAWLALKWRAQKRDAQRFTRSSR